VHDWRRVSWVVLGILLIAFGSAVAASAATYYVATNGSDSDPGSEAQPWATFAHSMTVLQPGDTLMVKDGTYYQSLTVTIDGTEGSPIMFKAVNDGQAIVDGEHARRPLRIGTSSVPQHDIVVEGMVFVNGDAGTVDVVGDNSGTRTARVTLRRVSAYNVGTRQRNYHNFNIAWAEDVLLEECAASGSGRCQYDIYCCDQVTLRRCWGKFMENVETPFIVFQIYNSDDCLMENCVGTMDQSQLGDCRGLNVRCSTLNAPYNTNDRNKFYGNVLYDFTWFPVTVDSDKLLSRDNVFEHNVCVNTDPTRDFWSFWYQWADINLLVKNVTLVGGYGGNVYIVEDPGGGAQYDPHVTLKNTIMMTGDYGVAADDPDYNSLTNSYNCYWDIAISNWNMQASEGPGEFTANPGFDTATYGRGGYLFIPDSSPCIGAGEGGEDVGATVLYRYVDGVLTSDPLWPWPMEDRIVAETALYTTQQTSVTWESMGGIWATLDGIYGPQAPTADFSGSPLSGDAPLTVDFTDLSTQSPTSWSWTFGDGGTSGAQHPSHEYTTANTYTVSLEACNAEGCDTETKVDYITVTGPQPPVADFSGNPLSGDVPLDVSFTDLSTESPTSWSWTFGDGGTSGAQHPSHQYTVANTYTVSLEACNGAGCDTETKTDYISATEPGAPVANFSGSPTSGYAPLDVDFTDLSTENPTSWSWTFGDGGTSGAQHPSHQYTTVDTYTVSLEACNAAGCDTETKVDYINVQEQPSQSCHVGAIDLVYSGPPKYTADATITAHDQDCAALTGVMVTVQWYYNDSPVGDPQSDVTDDYGQVTFTSPRYPAGTYKCCVTNMEKTGYPYEPGDNHETCDSIVLP